MPQTIEHILFSCDYVTPIWKVVVSVFHIIISFESILGVDNTCDYDNIITLVSFRIYTKNGYYYHSRINQDATLTHCSISEMSFQLV